MTHVVQGAHFGLSLFLEVHLVGLDLHVAAACSNTWVVSHMITHAGLGDKKGRPKQNFSAAVCET